MDSPLKQQQAFDTFASRVFGFVFLMAFKNHGLLQCQVGTEVKKLRLGETPKAALAGDEFFRPVDA